MRTGCVRQSEQLFAFWCHRRRQGETLSKRNFICHAAGLLFIVLNCWLRKRWLNRYLLLEARRLQLEINSFICLCSSEVFLKFCVKIVVFFFLLRWKLHSSLVFSLFILFMSSSFVHIELTVFFPSFLTHPKPKYNYSFHSVLSGGAGLCKSYAATGLVRKGFPLVSDLFFNSKILEICDKIRYMG